MNGERDILLVKDAKPLHRIIAEVAEQHGLSYAEMISHRRHRYVAWPRQEAMWRCVKETSASFPEVARAFGGRDHTTIIYGVRAYEKRMGAGT